MGGGWVVAAEEIAAEAPQAAAAGSEGVAAAK
jgi:hypothetical protein